MGGWQDEKLLSREQIQHKGYDRVISAEDTLWKKRNFRSNYDPFLAGQFGENLDWGGSAYHKGSASMKARGVSISETKPPNLDIIREWVGMDLFPAIEAGDDLVPIRTTTDEFDTQPKEGIEGGDPEAPDPADAEFQTPYMYKGEDKITDMYVSGMVKDEGRLGYLRGHLIGGRTDPETGICHERRERECYFSCETYERAIVRNSR